MRKNTSIYDVLLVFIPAHSMLPKDWPFRSIFVHEVLALRIQPDVFIVSDPLKSDGCGVRRAPDWLAEVLSPSTARHDQFVKLPRYERAGVREVWLIRPLERTVTLYRLEAGSYGRPTILELKGKTQLTAVPDVIIDWDRLLARIS